jgi:glucose/arabinose dehydrogenase
VFSGCEFAIMYPRLILRKYGVQVQNTTLGDDCTDLGRPNGRPDNEIFGCKSYGRLSRFPVNAAGDITGPEQFIVDPSNATNVCAQFGNSPIDRIAAGPDGFLYLSVGAGHDQFTTDHGQLGNNPCAIEGAEWGGAFRSQDMGSLDGKIIRIDPATLEPTIVARGLNNPWRFAFNGSDMYITDTGIAVFEEINGPLDINGVDANNVANFGFPCMEGGGPLDAYAALNSPICTDVSNDVNYKAPLYNYTAPDNATRVSISAIAIYNNKIYFGDYSQSALFSVNLNGTGAVVEATMLWPVDLQVVPGYGLVYCDVVTNSIKSAPVGPRQPSSAAVLSLSGLGAFVLALVMLAL